MQLGHLFIELARLQREEHEVAEVAVAVFLRVEITELSYNVHICSCEWAHNSDKKSFKLIRVHYTILGRVKLNVECRLTIMWACLYTMLQMNDKI